VRRDVLAVLRHEAGADRDVQRARPGVRIAADAVRAAAAPPAPAAHAGPRAATAVRAAATHLEQVETLVAKANATMVQRERAGEPT
jgi:hypothetical protein